VWRATNVCVASGVVAAAEPSPKFHAYVVDEVVPFDVFVNVQVSAVHDLVKDAESGVTGGGGGGEPPPMKVVYSRRLGVPLGTPATRP
jgi:hypothetical protein